MQSARFSLHPRLRFGPANALIRIYDVNKQSAIRAVNQRTAASQLEFVNQLDIGARDANDSGEPFTPTSAIVAAGRN